MKIHKQAAIKTALVVLSFFIIVLGLSFIMINIPTNWILPILGVTLFCIVVQGIYKLILNNIEWEEESKKREEKWKKIDDGRHARKMNDDIIK